MPILFDSLLKRRFLNTREMHLIFLTSSPMTATSFPTSYKAPKWIDNKEMMKERERDIFE